MMVRRMMKRMAVAMTMAMVATGLSISLAPTADAYNGQKAAEYARKHYNNYNKEYNAHKADCTNFASQAAKAGGQSIHRPSKISIGVTQTKSYWYSIKKTTSTNFMFYTTNKTGWGESTTWVRVAGGYGFFDYFRTRKPLTISSNLRTIRDNARLGDIAQVQGRNESARGHTMVVGWRNGSKVPGGVEITFYYHSNDTWRALADFDRRYGKGAGTNTYTIYKM